MGTKAIELDDQSICYVHEESFLEVAASQVDEYLDHKLKPNDYVGLSQDMALADSEIDYLIELAETDWDQWLLLMTNRWAMFNEEEVNQEMIERGFCDESD